jgi:hypothetical protein
MIKVYLAAAIAACGLTANEIQVFSSQTNRIDIDAGSSFEKLYFGTAKGYSKAPEKYLNAKTMVRASARGLQKAGVSPAERSSAKKFIPVTAEAPGKTLFDWNSTDHDYIYVSLVTNTKGEQTLAYTLIVAEKPVKKADGEALAVADQKKL